MYVNTPRHFCAHSHILVNVAYWPTVKEKETSGIQRGTGAEGLAAGVFTLWVTAH